MSQRVYYLDGMRGLLILSIVLIHTLQVYNPDQTWLIYSDTSIVWAPYLIELLMLFTLPSFFMMSGYLAAMSIGQHGAAYFFESRLKRIVIPIISAAVILNSIQTCLLAKSGWMHFALLDYLKEGKWISHLWFLIDLAVFFSLIYIAVKYFSRFLQALDLLLQKYIARSNIYLVLMMITGVTVVFLALFSLFAPYLNNPILNIRSLAFYLPFFLFGVLLYRYRSLYEKMLGLPLLSLIIGTVFSYYSSQYFAGYEEKAYRFLYYFFDTFAHLLASVLCFVLFYRFMNRRTQWMYILSDASYTIYLFHHLFVIALGLLFIKFGINSYIALLILFLGAAGFSLLVHRRFIARIPWLAFLFNGKKLANQKKTGDS